MGAVILTTQETQLDISGIEKWDATTGGIFDFSLFATMGTPFLMFTYVLLGLGSVIHGIRNSERKFIIYGIPAMIAGAIAVFGGLYYSFAEEPHILIAIIPWIGFFALLAGLGLTFWLRSNHPAAWANIGKIFEEEKK